MSFNPKAAWESVKILTGGTTSYHAKPTIMRMRLPTGELATTDKENAEVLGPHFEKVSKKHLVCTLLRPGALSFASFAIDVLSSAH